MSAPTILGFRAWLHERTVEQDRGYVTPCWIWRLSCATNGYARTQLPRQRNKTIAVHRLAYENLVAPIGEGLELDHLCRVRDCCNPEHLEPVTRAENMRRGNTPRSHCRNGHPFTEQRKGRFCRICNAAWHRARRAKQLEAAA
jgi:hypothetical protein